jgi:GNAT superfamily N-acetyltransferase
VSFANSNACACEESGSQPLPTVSIELSAAHAQPKRDRLANHCEVIPAPRVAHDWILDVFRDQVRPFEGARDAALMRDALARVIRCGSGVCLVAVPRGYADDFAGWLVAIDTLPSAALYVYVRRRFRREAIGTLLLRARRASGPVGLAYWTDEAVAGAANKLPAEHSLAAYAALLAFKRKGI